MYEKPVHSELAVESPPVSTPYVIVQLVEDQALEIEVTGS